MNDPQTVDQSLSNETTPGVFPNATTAAAVTESVGSGAEPLEQSARQARKALEPAEKLAAGEARAYLDVPSSPICSTCGYDMVRVSANRKGGTVVVRCVNPVCSNQLRQFAYKLPHVDLQPL